MADVLGAPWAKAQVDSDAYHPLLCHLIDVAMVTRLLWTEALAPGARQQLASALGLGEVEAGTWVAFVAGMHDLGKLSPDFQLGRYSRDRRTVSARLASAGMSFIGPVGDQPHGVLTAVHLPPLLTSLLGVPVPVARRLGEVVAAHHGGFASAHELRRARDAVSDGAAWDEARRRHVLAVADSLELDRESVPLARLDDPSAMLLGGLVSVADWIGSISEPYFPFETNSGAGAERFDPLEYRDRSGAQARAALRTLRWSGWSPAGDARSFESLFPELRPRGVQEAAERLAESLACPGLVVVEAPTGEGKTEAAIFLADRAQSVAGLRGAYFALPTMTTSDQMLTRVHAFLASRYPRGQVLLELLHGRAALSDEMELLRRLGRPGGVAGAGEAGVDASVLAGEWFARRKRGMLAPFGVGTVDQALLAALQVRHVFVRLFGLAHKVVIVDEVHAYDLYMTSLMERLLEWLGGCGSLVLLLSATLPAERRRRLVAAYERGAGRAAVDLPVCPYPRLTWSTAGGSGAVHVGCSPIARKRLGLEWAVGDSATTPESLARQAMEAIADGGCGVVVCNTVRAAQEVHRTARQSLPGDAEDGGPVVDLLHAHFLLRDRQLREARSLTRFGKPGAGGRRPRRALLIATQIVEQSLDLDFDVMLSQLAPVDLLLQRAGRLHRHLRRDRPGPPGANLLLACPEADDGPHPDAGTLAVYDEHVLLRTWLALRSRSGISVPEEVEEVIEAVYGIDEPPADLSGPVRERWQRTAERLRAEREREEIEAGNRWIGPPDAERSLYELVHGDLAEDAPELHEAHQALTRLGPPSVQAVCLDGASGQARLPDGTAIEPETVPALPLVRRLLEHSTPISRKGLTHELLRQPVPKGWRQSSLLCRHRLILFEGGAARVGNWTLSLDPELGLEAERGG
jgi:CRISPR-associated endonuclease/helicase Cas3